MIINHQYFTQVSSGELFARDIILAMREARQSDDTSWKFASAADTYTVFKIKIANS